jgi:hypothetical protein
MPTQSGARCWFNDNASALGRFSSRLNCGSQRTPHFIFLTSACRDQALIYQQEAIAVVYRNNSQMN